MSTTDTTAAPRPLPWHEEGLARLMHLHALQQVAQWALGSMTTRSDRRAEPGNTLEEALQLAHLAEDVVRWAVTLERERGTSWDELDQRMRAADLPPASARYDEQVAQWRQALDEPQTVRVDGSADDPRIPHPADDPDKAADRLDNWLLEHTAEDDLRSAQPVSRHLRRHTTLSAMLHAGRYRQRLLTDHLVPPPTLEANAYTWQADLATRLAHEDPTTHAEMTAFAAENRTRAAMLRSLPGDGIPWSELQHPTTPAADPNLLAAETALLEKIAPFLADDAHAFAPSEIQVFRNLQSARAAGDHQGAAAIRPATLTVARTLTNDDRAFYYIRSDAGEQLHFALRSYLAAAGTAPPRRSTE